MNSIGNAFIWTAIASGPLLLLTLGVMSAERAILSSTHARASKDPHHTSGEAKPT